jgi:hypothetical protein
MNTTTITIYQSDAIQWSIWKKIKKMTSADLMHRIIDECKMRHQQEFYLSLPRPVEKIDKPLMFKRIRAKYKK